MAGLHFISAVCVVVNMMIGAGFLALPKVFFSGGLLVSCIILAVMGYVLVVSCMWEGRSVLLAGRVISSKKIPEVTEAFNVFMGSRWRDLYIIALSFSLLSVNWALAILFGQTMSSSVPDIFHGEEHCVDYATGGTVCSTRYLINIAILAILTTPLSVTNVKEQWWIQNTLALIRIFRMLLMCITPLLSLSQESLEFSFPSTFSGDFAAKEAPPLIFGNWLGVCFVVSASIFGMFLNGNIPIIIDSLEDRNLFASVLTTSFTISLGLYMWLSITVSLQFGSLTMTPCNLNWVGYRLPFWETCDSGSICYSISRCFQFIIAFCPAIDVASAYPYISIVLGNSLTEILFGMEEDCIRRANVSETSPLQHKPQSSSRGADVTNRAPLFDISPDFYTFINRFLRFIMNMLPLILGACIVNFSIVVQISGAVSVLVCLFFPALLSIACKEDIAKHGMDLIITADNFIKWVDNKLGSSYWVTGKSKPLDPEANGAYPTKPSVNIVQFLKFAFLFDYSGEGLNPENDVIESLLAKRIAMGFGFVLMFVMLYFSY